MSEQQDALLAIPASYNFHREKIQNYRNKFIDSQNFQIWHRNDMYRSTYAQNHSPDSIEPRSGHIPGYSGFIPTNRAESIHAKTFANKTKQILAQQKNFHNRSGLATTGFNVTQDALIDHSKVAASHKYGKTEIQTPNPAWIPEKWVSTTKETYKSPQKQVDPCYRETDKYLHTVKLKTKTSGFQQNRAYWDGKGWNPHPILSPANKTSEYRDRFNPELDFHRNVDFSIVPQLKPTEFKYKYNK